jgi:hypothetical protein
MAFFTTSGLPRQQDLRQRHGERQLVIVNLKNLTRKDRVHEASLHVRSRRVLSRVDRGGPVGVTHSGQCRALPLANFGTVSFTSALAVATGHGGTIADAGWTATAIELQAFTGAVPSELSP